MKQLFAFLITIAASLFAMAFTFTMAHAQEGKEGGIFGTIMVGGMYQTGKPGLSVCWNRD